MKSQSQEYKKFSDLAGRLLAVPHSEIKTKLDAEKKTKKREKSKTSSALGREVNAKD